MAVNLLTNPTFAANATGFATSSGTLTWQSGAGQDGAGFARFVSNGTGNRNIQASPVACAPGAVFSVEMYARWNAGTPKQASIMCQFLAADGVTQTGNIIGTAVTLDGTWKLLQSLNCTAPALTAFVRPQIRMLSGAVSDAMDIDNGWLNSGATIDRSVAAAGPGFSFWDGVTETPLPVPVTFWDGVSEVAVSASEFS